MRLPRAEEEAVALGWSGVTPVDLQAELAAGVCSDSQAEAPSNVAAA